MLASGAAYLKLQIVVFQLVFVNILGFNFLVRGIGAVLSQLSGDLLQLAFMRFQLFLLWEISKPFSTQ